jgi:NADH:ubiquinone oxidoreductase subunit 6 (subunit J)
MRNFWFYSHFNLCLNFFAIAIVLSILLVLVQNNPVYSVFSFIFIAFIVFNILLLLGAEFFALLIIIIYTGVITVLFLFVIVMYNLREMGISDFNIWYSVLFIIIITKLSYLTNVLLTSLGWGFRTVANYLMYSTDVVQFIGIFNGHYLIFCFCGLLIFIAMIGSVVLTSSFFKYFK